MKVHEQRNESTYLPRSVTGCRSQGLIRSTSPVSHLKTPHIVNISIENILGPGLYLKKWAVRGCIRKIKPGTEWLAMPAQFCCTLSNKSVRHIDVWWVQKGKLEDKKMLFLTWFLTGSTFAILEQYMLQVLFIKCWTLYHSMLNIKLGHSTCWTLLNMLGSIPVKKFTKTSPVVY